MDLKQQQSTQDIVDLKILLAQKQQELQFLVYKNEDLRKARLKAQDLFEQNDLYESFQKIIKDKDIQNERLKQELAETQN